MVKAAAWSVAGCLVVAACSQPISDSAWTELAQMEVARSEHPAVALGGQIVVLGGLVNNSLGRTGVTASVEAYDPGSDTWRRLPDLPEPRHHLMAAVVDDRLFAIGGFSESGFQAVDDVWELVGDAWVPRAQLPDPVGAGAAVVLEDVIYVVGGTPDGGLIRYDMAADSWEALGAPLAEREHTTAVNHEGELWVLGGRWPGVMHSTTEIYDPTSDSWRPGPSMIEARSGFGAVSLGGILYVAGGEVFSPDRALDSAERLENGQWATYEKLPFGLHGNPLIALAGKIYLPGGSIRAAGVDNPGTLWVIEP